MIPSHDFESRLAVHGPDFDPDKAISSLREFGCFVIRNAVPASVLSTMHEFVKDVYKDLDQRFQRDKLDPHLIRRSYGYGILRPFEDEYLLPDGHSLAEIILGCVARTKLAAVIEGHLTSAVSIMLEASHIRRQAPQQIGRPVPLHQDCAVMRMKKGKMLNFWFPLCQAGLHAPGISVFPAALNRLLPTAKMPLSDTRSRMYSSYEISEETLRENLENGEAWRPVLNRGDVMCLDGYTVHKTNYSPSMTQERYDFEVRFCPTEDVTPEMSGPFSDIEIGQWRTSSSPLFHASV